MKLLLTGLFLLVCSAKLSGAPGSLCLALAVAAPALFYCATRDKADAVRVAIASLGALPFMDLLLAGLLYLLALVTNDEWLRRVFRWRIIVLTGIDGAGKSTHAKLLAARLRSQGVDVVYYHFFEHPLTSALSTIYAKLRGKKLILHGEPGFRGDFTYTDEFRTSVRRSAAILRPLVLYVDCWMYLGLRLLLSMLRGRHVICDRYFYDYFIRLKVLGYPVPPPLWFLATRVIPHPHVLVMLDVNPILSYTRRKAEHPLWYYVVARREYAKLFLSRRGPKLYINTTFREVAETHRILSTALLPLLKH